MFLPTLAAAITRNPKAFFSTGPKDPAVIQAAEQLLGQPLSSSYHDFVLNYGKLSFRGIEIMGLPTLDRLNTGLPDMVFYNLMRRSRAALPPHLIAFRDINGIECHCMDTTAILPTDEQEVIIWNQVDRTLDERTGISFADYLLEEIEMAFEEE